MMFVIAREADEAAIAEVELMRKSLAAMEAELAKKGNLHSIAVLG